MFDTILFDLDETLYPYSQFVIGGFKRASRYACKHLGIQEQVFFRACLAEWTRNNTGKVFDRVLALFGLPLQAVPTLVQSFRLHDPQIRVYPDAFKFIRSIQDKKELGIITDGFAHIQKRKIQALNIARYFKTIVYSDECGIGNWKPSPVPYSQALKNLGSFAPEKAVYIGDNPHKDFAGAKKTGIYTMRLLRGQFRNISVSPELDAHVTFTSYTELLRGL